MTDEELQQFNDRLRQQAHSADVANRREEKSQTPGERQQRAATGDMERIATQAAEKAIASIGLQAGPGISVSGKGRNMTVGAIAGAGGAAAAPPGPAVSGINAKFVVCSSDGGSPPVYTEMMANFVNGILVSLT